ncbi:glutathione S-transferase N-terminal domain-containing protein [Candidatus Gracilibacteria bacterium]|nr:glutathione S-transferase N-terminal domain-containing protein [Candidatus Gracilibacteria bacterium]
MVDIYTKNYCPFCHKALALLEELKVEFKNHDITDTPEVMEELSKKSGFKTVPQVFVGEKCLGGYSDIAALHEKGELLPLLKA